MWKGVLVGGRSGDSAVYSGEASERGFEDAHVLLFAFGLEHEMGDPVFEWGLFAVEARR